MANELISKNGLISEGTMDLNTLGTDEYKIGGNRALDMPVNNTNIVMGV